MADYADSPLFSDLDRAVLAYADAMTQTPVEVPEAVFERLRHHFDEGQIVELTTAIAWENHRARFNHALGIEAEGFSEGAACAVPVRAPSLVARASKARGHALGDGGDAVGARVSSRSP